MANKGFSTGHIGLNVTDLSRSKEFYKAVFGFETIGESSDLERPFAFLGYGSEILLTLWQQSDGGFDKASAGLHHLSFAVGSKQELEEAEVRLKGLGARFQYEGIVPHREGASSGGIFFEDPDGIRLEIFTTGIGGDAAAPHGEAPSCGFF